MHDQLRPIIERAALASSSRIQVWDNNSVARVAQFVRDGGKQAVWVEGFSGAGKSHFAHRLAAELGWGSAVEIDGQLLEKQPQTPSYVDKVDISRLLRTIEGAQQYGGVVVDGVCLRDIASPFFERCTAFVVYVARVSAPTPDTLMWHDGFALESPDYDDAPWLWAVMNDYHRRHSPHMDADQILLRIEE